MRTNLVLLSYIIIIYFDCFDNKLPRKKANCKFKKFDF